MLIAVARAQPFGGPPGCCGGSLSTDVLYWGLVTAVVAIVLYAAFFGKTK